MQRKGTFHCQTHCRGGSKSLVDSKSTHILNSISLRGEPFGEVNREKNEGNHTDLDQLQKQQKLHKAPPNPLANSRVQPALHFAQDGNGKGDDSADGMEFEEVKC